VEGDIYLIAPDISNLNYDFKGRIDPTGFWDHDFSSLIAKRSANQLDESFQNKNPFVLGWLLCDVKFSPACSDDGSGRICVVFRLDGYGLLDDAESSV
jgi:hypothetical protein